MRRNLRQIARKMILLAALAGLTGCSTMPVLVGNTAQPPLREYHPPAGVSPLIAQRDPLEGFNRGSYRFNYYFDKYLFLPVVRSYDFLLPNAAKNRISCFVDHIGEFDNFYNNLLQGEIRSAGITLGRFACNTTVGVAGLWDRATPWGLTRQAEDLGQTLGRYGVGNGAYAILPVLGPSNARDTIGLLGDTAIFNAVGPAAMVDDDGVVRGYAAVSSVDTRYRISFRYHQTGSPFEYELVRMLYTMKRQADVKR